jgi:hypothetical protein
MMLIIICCLKLKKKLNITNHAENMDEKLLAILNGHATSNK